MSRVFHSITEFIGHTPLTEAVNIEKELGLGSRLLLKLEYMNPAGSVKDRAALFMLRDAEEKGLIDENTVIIEPTSGNTGIGLAAIAASKGLRIVLTDGSKGMSGAIAKAEELAASIEGAFIPGQFVNPANPMAHYCTTGPEIWEDTDGDIDMFIAGVGTGGTITGTGRYLKEKNGNIKVIAVEPDTSPVLSESRSGPHKIQGIGAGFVPEILDTGIYDEVMTIAVEDAYAASRLLGKKEGFLTGISSGAALHAAILQAQRPENEGKTIVALLPDSGDRYYSTPIFGD